MFLQTVGCIIEGVLYIPIHAAHSQPVEDPLHILLGHAPANAMKGFAQSRRLMIKMSGGRNHLSIRTILAGQRIHLRADLSMSRIRPRHMYKLQLLAPKNGLLADVHQMILFAPVINLLIITLDESICRRIPILKANTLCIRPHIFCQRWQHIDNIPTILLSDHIRQKRRPGLLRRKCRRLIGKDSLYGLTKLIPETSLILLMGTLYEVTDRILIQWVHKILKILEVLHHFFYENIDLPFPFWSRPI